MQRVFNKYLTRIHKWAGLVLSLQILFWFGSGFFMTLFPIDQVRGRHLVEKQVFSLTDADIVPIEIAMTAYDGDLTGARLVNVAGRPIYILLGKNGSQMLDARSGSNWNGVGQVDVRNVAQSSYKGEGELASPSGRRSLRIRQKHVSILIQIQRTFAALERVSGVFSIWLGSSILWTSQGKITLIGKSVRWTDQSLPSLSRMPPNLCLLRYDWTEI